MNEPHYTKEDFEGLVRIRHEKIEGVGPWTWPIADTGAWAGPSEEFASIRDHMMPYVKNRNVIVQAGGCCGMYPLLWSVLFNKVITFEPAPLNWYCLQKNCGNEPKIEAHKAAIGDNNNPVTMLISDLSNVGCNRVSDENEMVIKISQMTLDSLNLEACDAIQFDIEGYEPAALMGAAETIKRFRPVVCLETKNPEDVSHLLLSEWGYRISSEVRFDTIFVPI